MDVSRRRVRKNGYSNGSVTVYKAVWALGPLLEAARGQKIAFVGWSHSSRVQHHRGITRQSGNTQAPGSPIYSPSIQSRRGRTMNFVVINGKRRCSPPCKQFRYRNYEETVERIFGEMERPHEQARTSVLASMGAPKTLKSFQCFSQHTLVTSIGRRHVPLVTPTGSTLIAVVSIFWATSSFQVWHHTWSCRADLPSCWSCQVKWF